MRTSRTFAGLAAAGGAAAIAVLYAFPPAQYHFYPRCPVYATTHLLCPGCGGTRAMSELLHLHLKAALHYNALLTVLAPFALVWFALFCYRTLRQERLAELALPRPVFVSLLVLALLFAVARNTGVAFAI